MIDEKSPFHGLEIAENPVLEVSSQERSLQQHLDEHMQHYHALPEDVDPLLKAKLSLDIAECHLGIDQKVQAHDWGHRVLPVFIEREAWQEAVDACDIIYNCGLDDALVALGNGIWLAVTFPIDADTSVQMLHHVVDETPNDSDGAAVAAMLAHYLAETRSSEKQHQNLTFLTNQVIAQVARRHRGIEDSKTIQTWIKMYELDELEKLLPRMALILDTIVGDAWWYDRDKLRHQLPVN